MITKKEIRQEVSKIKKLDQAYQVCFLNDELQKLLTDEGKVRMFNLLTRIEKRFVEKNVPEYKLEDLSEFRNDLNVADGVWASIHACYVFIDVMVL